MSHGQWYMSVRFLRYINTSYSVRETSPVRLQRGALPFGILKLKNIVLRVSRIIERRYYRGAFYDCVKTAKLRPFWLRREVYGTPSLSDTKLIVDTDMTGSPSLGHSKNWSCFSIYTLNCVYYNWAISMLNVSFASTSYHS